MLEIDVSYSTIAVALASAAGGAFLTWLVQWLQSKREFDLRLWEKIIDRRIQAHEKLLRIAIEMRSTQELSPNEVKVNGTQIPSVMRSREKFENWMKSAIRRGLEDSTWLAKKAKREIYFIQDYLINLKIILQDLPNEEYPTVGAIIKQDFIDLSKSIESAAAAFFQRDMRRLSLTNVAGRSSYPASVTVRRLQATALFRIKQEFLKRHKTGALDLL